MRLMVSEPLSLIDLVDDNRAMFAGHNVHKSAVTVCTGGVTVTLPYWPAVTGRQRGRPHAPERLLKTTFKKKWFVGKAISIIQWIAKAFC